MYHTCSKTLGEHGCALCLRNRVYEKRVWTHRMDLEARCHEHNSFLTLTYDDDNLPANGSLVRKHAEDYLKRLRFNIHPLKLRLYLCGEYGEKTQRPHYHAALFGLGTQHEDIVRDSWGMGNIMLAELNIATIRYVCGYVTKKFGQDEISLNGREPLFDIKSRGLGRGYVKNIVDTLDCSHGEQLLNDDVPTALRLHGRNMPLGRYMRNKIRKEVSSDDEKLAEAIGASTIYRSKNRIRKADEKMHRLRQDYENSSMSKKMTFNEYLAQKQKQKFLNTEAQFKLNNKETL